MSARARWIAVGVLAVIVLGVAALYWFNTNLTQRPVEHGPHTWAVQQGAPLVLLPTDVDPGDEYICPGGGRKVGTPDPGTGVTDLAGLSVETAEDGTVTATCEPGPPGNV
jgi:hypothetical protein